LGFLNEIMSELETIKKNTTDVSLRKTTQKTTQKILSLLTENPELTRCELAKQVGLSEDGIKKKRGIIRRIGPDKGGHWKVVK